MGLFRLADFQSFVIEVIKNKGILTNHCGTMMRMRQMMIGKNTYLHSAVLFFLLGAMPSLAQTVTPVSATTASGSASLYYNPLYLIDNSGLSVPDETGLHDASYEYHMWCSGGIDTTPTVEFDLGAPMNITAAYIWNYNWSVMLDRGARVINISVSIDNVTFTPVASADLTRATGNLIPAQVVNFTGSGRYVRFHITSNWGNSTYSGLSEVKFNASRATNLLSVTRAGTGKGTVTADVSGVEGNGINCGADCSETYNQETVVTLTAMPANGSTFGGWSGDLDCTDGQVTMNAPVTCTAAFNLVTTVTIPAATGGGTITLTTESPGCGFYNVSTKTEAQVGNDPSYDYPHGLVEFSLSCATADVTITFPGSITDLPYRKYGPTTPGEPATVAWYTFSNVTLNSSTSITAHFYDGQLGDDTGVDGLIVDQGGVGQALHYAAIPTMNEWGMLVLMVFLGIGSIYYLKRRRLAI
jgi:hypothetical protein